MRARIWSLLLVALLIYPTVSEAAFAVISTPFVEGLDDNGGTTATSFNSTGANLIVVYTSIYFLGTGLAISDTVGGNSNTWTACPNSYTNSSVAQVNCWYTVPTNVGASHTFTVSCTGCYAAIGVMAFSGADATPFDQETGSNGNINGKPGTLTPGGANYLLVSGMSVDSNDMPAALDSGYTAFSVGTSSGNWVGIGIGYLIQSGGPTAVDPIWTGNSMTALVTPMNQMSFQVSGGGGGGGGAPSRCPLLGVC